MNFLLVAINDAESDVRAFMDNGGYHMPILLDPSGGIAGPFGVTAVPTAIFLDAEGRVANMKVGGMTAAEIEAFVATTR